MDFTKYTTNLENQLKLVNADIMDKQEELEKLKEFRSRIKGGLEVINQIKSDIVETNKTVQQEIKDSIRELTQETL